MKRNKYINTFNTTIEYDNYIESAAPEFPNVALTKDDGEIHYMRTSPNDHVWYGEAVDSSQALPTISLNGTVNTPTLDTLTNMFYLDSWSNTAPTSISFGNKSNLKTIKKMQIDTFNVTNMGDMFYDCTSLTSLDLSKFNTSNVTNMSSMFQMCSSLTSLDLSKFNTSNVTNMSSMFYNCSSLTSLDLSNFDTSNIKSISDLFQGCSNLRILNLSNWTLPNITSMPTLTSAIFMYGLYQNIPLTDVYITDEHVLNLFTNNLTSSNGSGVYINSSATIHYNGTDYKWQNNAWTPQS